MFKKNVKEQAAAAETELFRGLVTELHCLNHKAKES